MANVFVDSTTLLYPLDVRTPIKSERSEAWLKALRDADLLTMSPQVLNECYSVVWRRPAFAHARQFVRGYLTDYALWTTARVEAATTLLAWDITDRYRVGFWDGLLLASAQAAKCSYFLSEDLNDGRAYGGVRAINPFRHAPEDVLGRALP
jgi:predicted nucleic acid-binding protein